MWKKIRSHQLKPLSLSTQKRSELFKWVNSSSEQWDNWNCFKDKEGVLKCPFFCNGCQWHLVILLLFTDQASSYSHEYCAGIMSSADPVHPVLFCFFYLFMFLFFFLIMTEKNKQWPTLSLRSRWWWWWWGRNVSCCDCVTRSLYYQKGYFGKLNPK